MAEQNAWRCTIEKTIKKTLAIQRLLGKRSSKCASTCKNDSETNQVAEPPDLNVYFYRHESLSCQGPVKGTPSYPWRLKSDILQVSLGCLEHIATKSWNRLAKNNKNNQTIMKLCILQMIGKVKPILELMFPISNTWIILASSKIDEKVTNTMVLFFNIF